MQAVVDASGAGDRAASGLTACRASARVLLGSQRARVMSRNRPRVASWTLSRPGSAREVPSDQMATLSRRDTAPELALRRELHKRGMRYRLQVKTPGSRRRTIDIAFPSARLAVFVDGCFWHGCPAHGTQPQANRDWWLWKIARNQARDADTNRLLLEAGWTVVRVWEHDEVSSAADTVGDGDSTPHRSVSLKS